jgi:hypothetical protein
MLVSIGTLISNSALLNSNASYQSFFNQYTNAPVYALAQADGMLKSTNYVSPSNWLTLQDNNEKIDSLYNNAGFSNLTISQESTIDLWAEQVYSIYDSIKTNRNQHLNTALYHVQNASTTLPIENAWKQLLTYQVKEELGNNNDNDDAQIVTLAHSDQLSVGSSVRHAWQYMPDCVRFELLDPKESNVDSEERSNSDPKHPTPAIGLYPNPVQDILSVSINFEANQWLLSDILGRIVKTGSPMGIHNFSIDFSDMQQGVYILSFVKEDGTIASKTIIRTNH